MVLHLKDGRYLHCESYGIDTWGKEYQVSLIKKRKYWYVHIWLGSNTWDCNDYNEDIKLNVIEELDELPNGCVLNNQDEYEQYEMLCRSFKC